MGETNEFVIRGYHRFNTEGEMMAYISARLNEIERFTIFDVIDIKNEFMLFTFILGFLGMKQGVFEPSSIMIDLYDDYPAFSYSSDYFNIEWTNKYWFYDQGVQRPQWLVKLTVSEKAKPV